MAIRKRTKYFLYRNLQRTLQLQKRRKSLNFLVKRLARHQSWPQLPGRPVNSFRRSLLYRFRSSQHRHQSSSSQQRLHSCVPLTRFKTNKSIYLWRPWCSNLIHMDCSRKFSGNSCNCTHCRIPLRLHRSSLGKSTRPLLDPFRDHYDWYCRKSRDCDRWNGYCGSRNCVR